MLEMNELDDMKNFFRDDGSLGEECHGGLLGADDIDTAPSSSLIVNSSLGQEDEDDFLFIDAEDDDNDHHGKKKNLGGDLYKLVNASDNNNSGGGMRRVQSMGAMTMDPNKFSLLTSMAPDIHTIHEDYDSDDDDEDIHIVTPPNHYYSQEEEEEGEQKIIQVNFGEGPPEDDEKDSSHHSSNNKSQRRSSSLRNSLRSSLNSSTHSALSSSSLHSSFSSSQQQPKKSCLKKSPSTTTLKRSTSNVSFGSLEIRSYAITAGDAPTPNGVPLSLDWDHDPSATQTIDVDTYEANRGERRNKNEMYVPNQFRVYLLMRDAGMSRRQIQAAIEESQRAFRGRQRTMKNLKMQPVEEVVERTKRSLGRMKRRLGLGNSR